MMPVSGKAKFICLKPEKQLAQNPMGCSFCWPVPKTVLLATLSPTSQEISQKGTRGKDWSLTNTRTEFSFGVCLRPLHISWHEHLESPYVPSVVPGPLPDCDTHLWWIYLR